MKPIRDLAHHLGGVASNVLKAIMLVSVASLLSSCGGNTPDSGSAAQSRMLAATQTVDSTALAVSTIEKVSETRVGRTTFDYGFRVTVKNPGVAQGGVKLVLQAVGKGATIVNGSADVGTVGANSSSTATSLIVIRQDRSYPFDRASLKFNVTSTGPIDTLPGTQKAEASLLPGVRILSADEIKLIVSQTDTSLVFGKDIGLVPGTVFIAGDTAYKSLALSYANGNAVVSVGAPLLEEIFSRVEVRGEYTVTDSAAQAKPMMMTPAAVSAGFTDTVSFADGGLSGVSTTTGSLTLDVNYVYDKSQGGLQNATLTAVTKLGNVSSLTLKDGASAQKTIKGKSFYIPIQLSIYDALLNTVGVKVAGLYIPVDLTLSASAKFQVSGKISTNFDGVATATYNNGVSSASFSPVASGGFTTSGVSVSGTIEHKLDAGVYLNLRPALSALNTVALAGVDMKIGPRAQLSAKETVGGTPPYCLKIDIFGHADASFYFKTIGTSITGTPAVFEKSVFSDPLFGTCLSPTTVTVTKTSAASTPPVFGQQIEVEVLVKPKPGQEVSGKVPTGSVTVESGDQSCKAKVALNGVASCKLSADQAGTAVNFNIGYEGDPVYEKSTASTTLTIDKSPTSALLVATPTTTTVNNAVLFKMVVSPSPDLQQKLPSGAVSVITSSGDALCTATLDASGIAFCSGQMQNAGTINVIGHYGGDPNYLTTTAATVQVTVNPSTGPTSATLVVPDPQSNWSGLPATIQFSDIVPVSKTSFQISGNSQTCGTGERGSPLFSNSVPSDATFYAARTVINVPYTSSGPGVNRRNCSSFIAIKMIPNPNNPAQQKARIWMNGTGRGQSFTGGGTTRDWESQVRYDSGDPWTGAGASCIGGTVANSGFFGANWSSGNCSAGVTY